MTVAHFTEHIPDIEKTIGYTFRDKTLLTQAFTRTSFCNEEKKASPLPRQSNEVLEFFGDSVLSIAIVSLLMQELSKRYEHGVYTELTEGDLSNIKSHLSDKKHLSEGMKSLGLQRFLCMGEGDIKLGIQNEPSVMEDLFESIIGAVYIDCDMNIGTVMSVVSHMLSIQSYLTPAKARPMQSYKNALQEFCADKKHRLPAPVYNTVSESGPEHKRVYERAVLIGERVVATGKGKNQKIADSAAAEAALKILQNECIDDKNVNVSVLSELKMLASKQKQPSPEFRDLGETPTSTPSSREFMIECRCMGASAVGQGKSKQEARIIAARKVLETLTPKPEEQPRGKGKKRVAKPSVRRSQAKKPTKKRTKS